MTYAAKDHTALALLYLTKLSSFRMMTTPTDPIVIPLAAKYDSPDKFGAYVARHNDCLNNHRNIAIVGLVPDAMDAATAMGDTLWTSIKSSPGVYCCNPYHRTHDLGKWNISCSASSHQAICEWIHTNLVKIWDNISKKGTLTKIGPSPPPNAFQKDAESLRLFRVVWFDRRLAHPRLPSTARYPSPVDSSPYSRFPECLEPEPPSGRPSVFV
jgi:hypothetical protein